MCACIPIWMYTFIYSLIHVSISMYLCMCGCTYEYMHVCICACMCTKSPFLCHCPLICYVKEQIWLAHCICLSHSHYTKWASRPNTFTYISNNKTSCNRYFTVCCCCVCANNRCFPQMPLIYATWNFPPKHITNEIITWSNIIYKQNICIEARNCVQTARFQKLFRLCS